MSSGERQHRGVMPMCSGERQLGEAHDFRIMPNAEEGQIEEVLFYLVDLMVQGLHSSRHMMNNQSIQFPRI
jgi:hypothetical protein